MSGQTDRLIQLAGQVFSDYRGPAYDMLLASGEQVSIALLSMALEKRGLKNIPLLGYQAGIETDPLFSRARIKDIKATRLKKALKEGFIPLVAGFQGNNNRGSHHHLRSWRKRLDSCGFSSCLKAGFM